MKKSVNQLWKSFLETLQKPGSLENYCNYYMTVVTWVKDNIDHIGEDTLKNNRLDRLIKLDPSIYIIDEPDLELPPLCNEINRLSKLTPKKIDTLAMIVGNILWDMVTIRTGKDCPNCKHDELRFLLALCKSTEEEKLVLSCESCGWTELTDGTPWNQMKEFSIMPASKKDVMRFISVD